MNLGYAALSIAGLAVLQLAASDSGAFSLNLLLVYCSLCLLAYKPEKVFYMSLLAGALLDVFSGHPDGVMAVSLAGGVMAGYYLTKSLLAEKYSDYAALSYVLLATAGYWVCFSLAASLAGLLAGGPVIHWPAAARGLTYSIFWHIAAFYPVYRWVRLQQRLSEPNKKYESV